MLKRLQKDSTNTWINFCWEAWWNTPVLDKIWTRIGSVTKEQVITAVLRDEIEIHKSRLNPSYSKNRYSISSRYYQCY